VAPRSNTSSSVAWMCRMITGERTLVRSKCGALPTILDGSSRVGAAPNKRLKLAGADRLNGTGVLSPWRGTDCVPHPCAGERVARSLSAIR